MKTFWRPYPLDDKEYILLNKLFEAHSAAVFRQNISSEVLKGAFYGNGGDFFKAAAAALCTLGGVHAPIMQTYELLDGDLPVGFVTSFMECGQKIPGWGSGFVKGKSDPYVDNVLIYLATGWNQMSRKIDRITNMLHDAGKNIYPNMACVTAATGVILKIPKELTPALLVHGRTLAWAELLYAAEPTRQTIA